MIAADPAPSHRPALSLSGLSVSFGGFKALSDVSFDVSPGRITAVIGPNGAGKTTLFNLVTGHHRPTRGRVLFDGRPLDGMPARARVRAGMLRSFQRTNVFPEMSVLENVLAALSVRDGRIWSLLAARSDRGEAEAQQLLRSVGLSGALRSPVQELSHGDQKVLDLALALAYRPRLLLLDEPTAGMSGEDTRRVIALVERLVREKGLTLLFTEHDMEVVFAISDRIVVLHHGEVIAAGDPAAVRADPVVKRVYLGARH